ncbi:unnamed protein product [Penicillium nalgiovense]|nr:unnamed protein product [Penicillium nalgiovense]
MAKHLVVSHPSPLMLQQKTHSLKEIEKLETPYYKLFEELVGCGQTLRKGDEMVYYQAKNQLSECQALLSDIQAFDPGFGRVWMASGFRTAQATSIHNGEYRRPTNYDWALIEVPPERVGGNTTHEGHTLKQSPLPEDFCDLRLCISGQKSGYSEGYYNSLQEAHVNHEMVDEKIISVPTVEHSVIPKEDNLFFTKPGDSGALVYTKDSHVVVGLCFAGQQSLPSFTFFTHISDLIADIKKSTGATKVSLL